MALHGLLLVEDDAATREVLTVLLEADGWSVLGVDSGEAAVAALREDTTSPDVVLCDLHLPGVHGAELAAELRTLAPRAKLLAMSASAPQEGTPGYDTLLRKPFGAAELRNALTDLGGAASGRGAGPEEGDDDGQDEPPVLNMETFLKLEQQMGARARELYAFALADAGDRLRRMEQAIQFSDEAAYRAEAHALKGSAGMIGAERLAVLAAAAEGGLNQPSRSEKVPEMHLACDQIRLMLETLFPM